MHIYTIRRSFYALAIKLQKQQQQQQRGENWNIVWLTFDWQNAGETDKMRSEAKRRQAQQKHAKGDKQKVIRNQNRQQNLLMLEN